MAGRDKTEQSQDWDPEAGDAETISDIEDEAEACQASTYRQHGNRRLMTGVTAGGCFGGWTQTESDWLEDVLVFGIIWTQTLIQN